MDSPEGRYSPTGGQPYAAEIVQDSSDMQSAPAVENSAFVEQKTSNGTDIQRCSGASADGEDSSLDSSGADDGSALARDPFSPECKIPLPVTFAPFDYGWVEPSFIRKRNERERQRVRNVNEGFERLRSHLPLLSNKAKDRSLSKVETLKYAISYIRHLQAMLKE